MRTPITFLLLCSTASLAAQSSRFEVGAQAGASLAWLRGNSVIDGSDALLGPAAGLTLQYDLSPLLGVRIGAAYQRKGMRNEVLFSDMNGAPIGTGSVRTTMDQLVVPLMLRATFGHGPRYSVGVGTYAGFLLGSRVHYKTDSSEGDTDNTDDLEPLDIGLSASAAAAFKLGEQLWLNAEVRYDKGLSNISALPVVNDGSIRTDAVCLLVGCGYRFGKVQ